MVHCRELAVAWVTAGAVRSPWVRQAFEETPWDNFVPRFYRWESGQKVLVDGTDPRHHDEWLHRTMVPRRAPLALPAVSMRSPSELRAGLSTSSGRRSGMHPR